MPDIKKHMLLSVSGTLIAPANSVVFLLVWYIGPDLMAEKVMPPRAYNWSLAQGSNRFGTRSRGGPRGATGAAAVGGITSKL